MEIEKAPDVEIIASQILNKGLFPYIDPERLMFMRSKKATARARARIWSFPKIWQLALNTPPHYVIEVLAHHFDHLSNNDKVRVLIHEFMHIPKNFSGALVPHRGIHKRIDSRSVEKLFKIYENGI